MVHFSLCKSTTLEEPGVVYIASVEQEGFASVEVVGISGVSSSQDSEF